MCGGSKKKSSNALFASANEGRGVCHQAKNKKPSLSYSMSSTHLTGERQGRDKVERAEHGARLCVCVCVFPVGRKVSVCPEAGAKKLRRPTKTKCCQRTAIDDADSVLRSKCRAKSDRLFSPALFSRVPIVQQRSRGTKLNPPVRKSESFGEHEGRKSEQLTGFSRPTKQRKRNRNESSPLLLLFSRCSLSRPVDNLPTLSARQTKRRGVQAQHCM